MKWFIKQTYKCIVWKKKKKMLLGTVKIQLFKWLVILLEIIWYGNSRFYLLLDTNPCSRIDVCNIRAQNRLMVIENMFMVLTNVSGRKWLGNVRFNYLYHIQVVL